MRTGLGADSETPVLAAFAGRDRWEWSLINANGVTYGHLLTQGLVNRVRLLTQAHLFAFFGRLQRGELSPYSEGSLVGDRWS